MGQFWAEVGASSIKFVIYAIVAFAGIVLGMKLRIKKNKNNQ